MRDNDIVVIAGGWSLSDYSEDDLCERLMTATSIGVNDSSLLIPCNHAVSMDRLWTEGRWPEIVRRYENDHIWIRKGVVKNMPLPDDVNQFQHEHVPSGAPIMTMRRGRLNGSNSGTCAVNLAYSMAGSGERVFLLGFDMCDGPNGEKHWYPPYPWRPNGATKKGSFTQWAREFEQIQRDFEARAIELINVNHRSQIKCLRTITFQEFLKS